jgi:hypothetical protein
LGFRLLPHVPRLDRQFAFSCTHCGAVLTYSDAHIPLGTPLWGTKLRSLLTFLGGIVLLSAIHLAGGRVAALAALAIACVILGAAHLLSPNPAYKVVNGEHPGDGTKP